MYRGPCWIIGVKYLRFPSWPQISLPLLWKSEHSVSISSLSPPSASLWSAVSPRSWLLETVGKLYFARLLRHSWEFSLLLCLVLNLLLCVSEPLRGFVSIAPEESARFILSCINTAQIHSHSQSLSSLSVLSSSHILHFCCFHELWICDHAKLGPSLAYPTMFV